MSYRNIHLALTPHPVATSHSAIDYACALAHRFEAKLEVTSTHLTVRTPTHVLAGGMMLRMARQFERDAGDKSSELEGYVTQKATSLGLSIKIAEVGEQWPSSSNEIAWRGRTSDLCILSLPQTVEGRLGVEDWLFKLGRPCVLYPNETHESFSLDTVLVAWDFSKSAARALFDALPLLKAARNVHLLTVRGEKDILIDDLSTPVCELLTAHGVNAEVIGVDIAGNPIGRTILDQAQSVHANLIVMGAYGHSRLKEFVLGGATKGVLNTSRIPLLMSH